MPLCEDCNDIAHLLTERGDGKCDECKGSGSDGYTGLETCPKCDGSGVCQTCYGSGVDD